MTIRITKIKPNPSGKDRPRFGSPPPSQLAAEWVDLCNDSSQPAPLGTVGLYHIAYAPGTATWRRVTTFSGTLPAGAVVRVHAGRAREGVIAAEDMLGADYHLFTGEDAYVWNNREGDSPMLTDETTNSTIDRAIYAPYPPEGAVLVRQGDRLVPLGLAASR